MNRVLSLPTLAILAIAACSPALAQAPAPSPSEEGGALDRLHIYEVSPGQLAGSLPVDTVRSSIHVSGSAQIQIEPDRVRVVFAVETIEETAEGASRENARRMNEVFAALRAAGVPGLQIETFGYSLQPNYRRPGQNDQRQLQIENYRLSNNIRVTADDITAAGPLIDAAIGAGANRVASLVFDTKDTDTARLEALRLAVRNAQQEASTIADALGMTLGEALEIRGSADRPQARMRTVPEFAAMDVSTPIEAGLQTVSAQVSIQFRVNTRGR